MNKVIGIVSLKGGVGKTTAVVSLGSALASIGKKVLLVDANLTAPNVSLYFNFLHPKQTLHHVLDNSANTHEAIYSLGLMDILPADIFNKKLVNPLKLRDKLKYVKKKYDVILIDSSPSLDEETLAVLLASDEIFVITTPDHPTLSTTLKAINLAKQRGTPISGIILNKVYNKKFEVNLDYVEFFTDIPVLAMIPHDTDFLKALSKLTPYIFYRPKSKGAREFLKLAKTIVGEKDKRPMLKSFVKMVPDRPEINRQIYYQSVFK